MVLSSLQKVPLLVAHRGYAAKYPENSLLAMKKALELGVGILEMDIQLTKDEKPVLLHDVTLTRVSSVDYSIFDLNFSDLENYFLSETKKFGDQYLQNPFTDLDALIQLASKNTKINLLVEIKQESIDFFGTHKVASIITSSLKSLKSQVTIIAYDEEFLQALKNQYRLGFIVTQWADIDRIVTNHFSPELVICNYKKIPSNYVNFSNTSWDWVLYEIVDPKLALAFAAKGVKFIETMEVEAMINDPLLNSRAQCG